LRGEQTHSTPSLARSEPADASADLRGLEKSYVTVIGCPGKREGESQYMLTGYYSREHRQTLGRGAVKVALGTFSMVFAGVRYPSDTL
jgi:hypothetical protein